MVFGIVSEEELIKSESAIDPSADAEVLLDFGSISENGKYVRFVRTKIFNQGGYEHANITIPKYPNAKILNIRGFTYNLVNGVVEKTPLDNDQIVEEKVINKFKIIKITFPQVKPGSVLDLEITRRFKPGYAIDEWIFQKDIPVVWSELVLRSMKAQKIFFFNQGLEPYTVSDHDVLSNRKTDYLNKKIRHRWARANQKPLKSEPFITGVNNYIAKIDFLYNRVTSYPGFNLQLALSPYFHPEKNNSDFLDDVMLAIDTCNNELDRAKMLFEMIRDTMKWSGYYGLAPDPLKDAWKKKEADVPTINFLLVKMMEKAGLIATPVILSTKENGLLHPDVAIANKFNYLVCGVLIDEEWILMDASDQNNQFGILPPYCLNEKGWKISMEHAGWVELLPKGYVTSTTQALINMDENGSMKGSLKNRYTSYAAYGFRQALNETGLEEFAKTENEEILSWELSNPKVENKDDYSQPLIVGYDLSNDENKESDLIYLEPVVYGQYKRNIFESADRKMPVNFPYRTIDRYVCTITIPDNYVVDELPQSQVYQMPDKDVYFQFTATSKGKKISIISNFRINGLFYPVEEYAALRSFFETAVNKQREQIVLRKIE
ncbi:MAG: hypothetical protein AAFO69_03595 [Bacteroidota bacterium]